MKHLSTTRTGSSLFLYGELFGQTPPIDWQQWALVHQWLGMRRQSALYGIDANAAAALRITTQRCHLR